MNVAKYLEKHFYDWAKIELVSRDSKELLYEGSVGECRQYLNSVVVVKPLNFAKDVTRIEIVV